MTCELDPKEVLKHLHDLGYYNITPAQLREFIRDLQQLIQHDMAEKNNRRVQIRSPVDSASSAVPNTTDESGRSSPCPASDPSNQRTVGKLSNVVAQVSCSSSESSSIAPARSVLRECTKHFSQKIEDRESLFRTKSADSSKASSKPVKTCDCAWRRLGCKSCEGLMSQEQNSLKTKSKENLAPSRPKSSFIRTWQTQASSYRTQRCDPVALYQQYQQVWKQQKLPGEDNRNDLRWSIRERLLGQQPLPRRSCSCGNQCPCELRGKVLPKGQQNVNSKIPPRGPFHIKGRIRGPMGCQKYGDLEVSDLQLRGVFEVGNDSGDSITTEKPTQGKEPCTQKKPPQGKEPCTQKKNEKGLWLSKEDIDKVKKLCSKIQESETSEGMSEEERCTLCPPKRRHDKSTCKYCGLIPYMLQRPPGSTGVSVRHQIDDSRRKDRNGNEADKRKHLPKDNYKKQSENQCPCPNKKDDSSGYWQQELQSSKEFSSPGNEYLSYQGQGRHCPQRQCPRQFEEQVSRRNNYDKASSIRNEIAATFESMKRKVQDIQPPTSNFPACPQLCGFSSERELHDQRSPHDELNLSATNNPVHQRRSDSYFETRIPVNLRGFQGEVISEVEVHKKQRNYDQSPRVTVSTKLKIHKI